MEVDDYPCTDFVDATECVVPRWNGLRIVKDFGMLKKNKQLVWWIALFVLQISYAYIFQSMTNHSIRTDVELMQQEMIEHGVAFSSVAPMVSTLRFVGTQLTSLVTTQFQFLAFSNMLVFILLYRLATKEKKEEQV